MKSKTRFLALASMMGALGVVFLCLSGILPLALYACPLLASACLIPVREECPSSYAWTCFAAISLLGLLLGPDREASLLFVFLGYYPLIQPNLRKKRPLSRFLLQLALYVGSVGCMYLLLLFVFRLRSVIEELTATALPILIATVVLGFVTFLLFDLLLIRFAALYRRRFARRKS